MQEKHKKLFIFSTISFAAMALVVGFASAKSNLPSAMTKATTPEYSISLGNISAAESSAKSFIRKTSGGADITFNTAGSVTNLSGYVANMSYADDNAIYNVTPITGLKEIRFQVANHANVKVMYGSDPNNMEYVSETYTDTILNTEVVIDLSDSVNVQYFRFIHFRGTGAYLKSFTAIYSCSPSPTRGVAFDSNGFSESVNYTIDDVITLDIKFTSASDTHMALALLQDWSGNQFGYFNIYANGTITSDPGVSMKLLDDGYYRVAFDLDQIETLSGTPSTVTVLFARSGWTDATGYVDFEPTSKVAHTLVTDCAFSSGNAITPAQSMKLPADKELIIEIQFSKEDEAGKQIALVLATDWSNMYGYFNLNNNGTGTWTGVGVQTLGERHYRYFFDIDLLPKYAGSSPTIVDFVWANGGNTNANGSLSIIEIR